MKKLLSIVVPCYNEQESLPLFINEVNKCMDDIKINYEIILIDDGSKDDTLNVMRELKGKNEEIKYISFSRNFGKESAMYAGLENAKGDYIVIMDADLQDPPYLLKEMIETLETNQYDSVATRRVSRVGEPKIRSFCARSFYKLINKMIDVEIVDGARDYRMMNRKMVNSVLSLKEQYRFTKGIFAWVGFRTKYIEFENVERIAGETSWNFLGLFKYAIEGIVSFSTFPLRVTTIVGVITSSFAFLFMLFIIVKKFILGDPVVGYPSTISIITLLGGIQLIALGIIGEYLAKTYLEVKNRPIYIIGESSMENKNEK